MVSHHKPLEGRRLYFVGIGGSGLSAYANVARRKSIAGTPGPPGFTTNDPIRRAGFVAGRPAG